MSSILLHKTKGLNPHLTTCYKCGKEGRSVVLLGCKESIHRCNNCDAIVYGGIGFNNPCPKCKHNIGTFIRKIEDNERIPIELCEECEAEEFRFEEEVKKGGVYFKCKNCRSEGVVKAETEMAKLVREKLNVDPPLPAGIEFDDCLNCRSEKNET